MDALVPGLGRNAVFAQAGVLVVDGEHAIEAVMEFHGGTGEAAAWSQGWNVNQVRAEPNVLSTNTLSQNSGTFYHSPSGWWYGYWPYENSYIDNWCVSGYPQGYCYIASGGSHQWASGKP